MSQGAVMCAQKFVGTQDVFVYIRYTFIFIYLSSLLQPYDTAPIEHILTSTVLLHLLGEAVLRLVRHALFSCRFNTSRLC